MANTPNWKRQIPDTLRYADLTSRDTRLIANVSLELSEGARTIFDVYLATGQFVGQVRTTAAGQFWRDRAYGPMKPAGEWADEGPAQGVAILALLGGSLARSSEPDADGKDVVDDIPW